MHLPKAQHLRGDAGKMLISVSAISMFGGLYGYIVQLYLKAIGFDSRAIGLMAMANTLCSMFLSIPFGLLGDHFGRRNSMLLGLIGVISSVNLLLVSREFPLLLVSFLLLGVGNSAFSVLLQPLYASYFEGAEMDQAFAVLGFVSLASNAIGGLLGYIPPILISLKGFSLVEAYWTTIAWSSILLYLGLAFGSLIRDNPKRRPFIHRIESKGALYRFVIFNIFIGFAAGMFIELATYFFSVKFEVESDLIGMVYFATSIVGALANLAVPSASRLLGTFRGVLIGLMMVLPLHLSIVIAPTFPVAAAFYIARTGVMNLSMTLLSAFTMRSIADEERATVNSLVTLASWASRGFGVAIGGVLMAINLELPGYISIAIYSASTATFYILFKGYEHSPSHPKQDGTD